MRNCVFALTRGYNDITKYSTLINRNSAIEENIYSLYKNDIDYIIFHEGNITIEHQNYIQSKCKLKIIFTCVKECFPGTAFNNDDKEVYTNSNGYLVSYLFDEDSKNSGWSKNSHPWGLNYRHMCEFHFVYILEYLKDYKYALRIDEDCIMKNKMNYFDLLNNNIKIVSGLHIIEGGKQVKNLRKFSETFMNENNIKKHLPSTGGPYTNVFMFDVQYFYNNILIRKYINEVKEKKFVIIYRWGDLPLWGEICYIFLNNNEYDFYNKNFKYYHGSHCNNVNIK